MDANTVLTLIVSVGVAILSGVISAVVLYFTHLVKVKEQIAKLEEKIMDKEEVQKRITILEESDKQKQKFFDFLNDQVIQKLFNKKG